MQETVDLKYDSRYTINIKGEVTNKKTKRILKPTLTTNGYMRQYICGKGYQVHRLIAEHFIPNPNNYPEINHIDCNRINNSIENLEWVTRSINMKRKFERGENFIARGEKHGLTRFTNKQVLSIREQWENGKSIYRLSKDFQCSTSTISDIVKRKYWNHI